LETERDRERKREESRMRDRDSERYLACRLFVLRALNLKYRLGRPDEAINRLTAPCTHSLILSLSLSHSLALSKNERERERERERETQSRPLTVTLSDLAPRGNSFKIR